MPVGCVCVSPNRSRIFFIIGRWSRSPGGGGGGTDWQRVGGFDSWPLDWMWMLLLPSLLSLGSSRVLSLMLPFPLPCCKRKPSEWTRDPLCVVVYIFRSVYVVLPCVCASASSTYICGTVDRVSLRSRSFYWVWTAEKRFSCFYIEAIFPSRPVAFKNTDFRRSGTAGRLAISTPLPFRESLVPSALSFGSVGLISRCPFALYATRNSKGRLKPTYTFWLPSRVCEWQNLRD